MFQLNHILTEQKNLMEQMMSMFAGKTSGNEKFVCGLRFDKHHRLCV